ncbi:MAG: shikimate dehydrogenase [Kiritimatiellaeota bacterium]|nr:shikimate dehydrogenase [Kiritimatiellota bacterium]
MTSNTYRFALLGHPVSQSLSPRMHTASFCSLGIQAQYELIDVLPEALAERLERCRADGFTGVNVTYPHKLAIVALMTRVDPIAQLAGAVNTVRFDADGPSGFNTDITGFLASLNEDCGITPEGKRVLVFGCGGAGRAVALGCAQSGAAEIALADCDTGKALQLAQELSRVPSSRANVRVAADGCAASREAGLVVHCTPAGLRAADVSPLPPEAFRPGQVLYDVVYAQSVTPTMRVAREAGAKTANGLGMLLHQGAHAFNLWTGLDADIEAMRKSLTQRHEDHNG